MIRFILAAGLGMACSSAMAQEEPRSSASMNLQATADKPQVVVSFLLNGEGKRFAPTWGLDLAWLNEQNLRKGMNHMGVENVGIGRTAFRTTDALTDDKTLGSNQTEWLDKRAKMFDIVSPTLPLVFTCDQEAGTDSYYVVNKSANVGHWAANINSHIEWMKKNTRHPIVGVSPFNEPDYWSVEEGATPAKQREVARLLREQYALPSTIAMVGGNTLNNDKAAQWYTPGKEYYEWGNTHQLAGSFDTFAAFYQLLEKDGKVGYGDEMHNVGEAMIGLEYGMTVGIWWGFDSRARGEFCDISRNGVRLAYGELRNNWTAASVYRHDDGRVKAFVGSSERQASTTSYQFLSPEREVYFDGRGPLRDFTMEIPGGTGYQEGQTNAERVIDITWGADVPLTVIEENQYRIYNKATTSVITSTGTNIVSNKYKNSTSANQIWTVKPCSPRIGGDYSFYDIELASNGKLRMNVLNFSTADGANVMAWAQNATPSSNEQWYLQYAGNGYYYIRNRESALYLTTVGRQASSAVNVVQKKLLDGDDRDRQMWRFLPSGVNYETVAPAAPVGLTAQSATAAVRLEWTANADNDLAGYTVIRAEKGTEDWNTIARGIQTAWYVDNTCCPGTSYVYKVKAYDTCLNQSETSQAVEAQPTGSRGLVAWWQLDGNTNDETANMMDAVICGTPKYINDSKSGTQALNLFASQGHYLRLPYQVVSDEMTICMWVNARGSGTWQRLFDFGNGTSQYMFLTTDNGSVMRFAIKNGGSEQTVDCKSKLQTFKWKHVAVAIGQGKVAIYVDGEEAASSTGITIKPSDIRPVLNYLGRSQFASDPLFNGYLDDVRIYNYALSGDEVMAVMNNETNGIHDMQAEGNASGKVYGLDGRPMQAPKRGINIINGRKVTSF